MTQQISDTLFFKNKTYYIPMNLMYQCPEFKKHSFHGHCSNNWRGWVGTWQISGNKLFLVSFRGESETWEQKQEKEPDDGLPHLPKSTYMQLENLFPDRENRIHASWFSGQLRFHSENNYKNCYVYDVVDGVVLGIDVEPGFFEKFKNLFKKV